MYGKIFSSMYEGSMVGAGAAVFAVFGYAISKQQPPDFNVELNSKLLSAILGEPEDEVSKAIEYLCAPDLNSRTEKHEGRRLLKVGNFTYHMVNGESYHSIRNYEERKIYNRQAQAKFREKKKALGEVVPEVESPKKFSAESVQILNYLNTQTGRSFRESESNLKLIQARLSEPEVTVDGCIQMITRQTAKWKTDPKMCEYLRPETLFGKSKFDSYYSAKDMPTQNSNGHSPPTKNQNRPLTDAELLREAMG